MAKNPIKPGDNETNDAPRPRARRARKPVDVPAEINDVQLQSMASEPNEHDIRMRAYHRFLERGGAHGRDFDDWVAAERELKGM